jgi:hypothetical protein
MRVRATLVGRFKKPTSYWKGFGEAFAILEQVLRKSP